MGHEHTSGIIGAMTTKNEFSGLEVFRDGVWTPMGNPDDHLHRPHPLAVRPITEQVAAIILPPGDPARKAGL